MKTNKNKALSGVSDVKVWQKTALIAAAPELLEALKLQLRRYQGEEINQVFLLGKIVSAIKKAEGH